MSPEEMSFRNLVEWYREELTEVLNGAHFQKVFNKHQQRYLIKHGITHRVPTANRALPTPEAIEILRDTTS